MTNAIDWDAERKRFEAWHRKTYGLGNSYFARRTTGEYRSVRANMEWNDWQAALTYGRQDAKPDADSDTIEVRIPVAVSNCNKYYAHRWHGATMSADIQDVLTNFDESQVYIVTARVPKYRIPEIAADKVEPADTGDAT